MNARLHRAVLLLTLGAAIFGSGTAQAVNVYLSMDVLPETVGWVLIDPGSGTATLNNGILTLTTPGYMEYRKPGIYAPAYTIEFRMRILSVSQCCDRNIGVWYHGLTNCTQISINPARISVIYPYDLQVYATIDAMQWHTYRIEVLDSHHQVFVDGVLTLDFQHTGTGACDNFIMWGDLGGGGASQSEWDYFSYQFNDPYPVPVAQTSWGKIKALYRDSR